MSYENGVEVRDDTKTDMSDDNMVMNDENPHAGLDPFKSSNNNNNNTNNNSKGDDDNPFNVVGSTSVEEGFDETRPETELSSEALLKDKSSSKDDNNNNNNPGGIGSRSLFSKHGKRPTSAGEPSPNVPTRCDISVVCEIRWIYGVLTGLIFLITLFDAEWIEFSFQSLFHWANDRETNLGRAGIVLSIFDVPMLNVAGGADVILMIGAGYIWDWQIGTGIYMLCSFTGCIICFIIGKVLYRDAWFQFWSNFPKFENFRLLDRSIQDYGFWLTVSLRLCPYIPFGFVSYLLSFTNIQLKDFAAGHFFGSLTSVVFMCYAGSLAKDISDLDVDTYQNNDASYAMIILLSVLFVITFVLVSFLIYQHFNRLVIGDNRSNMEQSVTESEDSGSESEDGSENNDAGSDSENSDGVGLSIGDDGISDGAESSVNNGANNNNYNNINNNNKMGMGDIEMAQYDNNVKPKKKKKRKKKKNNRKQSFFSSGWDNEQAGLAMESPFGEGKDLYDEKPTRDMDVAAMDPSTPRR